MNKLSAMTPKRAGGETMELSDEEIAEIAERMEATDPTCAFWRNFARAILAAHEAKKQQQDHLTQPCGVRTEPGEENAAGVGASDLRACDAAQQGEKQ